MSITALYRWLNSGMRHAGGMVTCMLIAACSISPEQPREDQPGVQYAAGEGMAWHACRFRMPYESESSPDWHVDVALAHLVVAPVLDEYRSELLFWRFHRRAAHDRAGHQFSFIFYTEDDTASALASTILTQPWLDRFEKADVVTWISCADSGGWQGGEISDSSDSDWSEEVQHSWPFFIMGVSEFWLDLIQQIAATEVNAVNPRHANVDNVLAGYERVNSELASQWQQQGRHALLHHLNAMFGYSPLLMRY